MFIPRLSTLAASSLACLVGLTGCLRQTAAPMAAASAMRRSPASEEPEGQVVGSDQPMASFVLDGEPFCFAGTNNYYLIYKSRKMVDDVLETTKNMGLKVIRIWAYLDRGSLDGSARNVDGAGEKGGVYFQAWDPATKRPVYNDGPTGIEHLDYVLDKAKKLDLKVMLVLTNNWKDFGGMDQYLVWYGLNEHQKFYTDPTVVRAYEDWVAHLVKRKNTVNGVLYRDDPTIFGWELANEPRCISAGDFDRAASCNPPMLVKWVDETSSFIKSIDPNHLVSVGDEGFFANGSTPHYDGADGGDHEGFLAVAHVDFGTFHLYPESWGHRVQWSSKWIDDHIDAARRAGKPTMLEEYGIIARRDANNAIKDDARRRAAYTRWHEMIQKRGGSSALFWMLAGVDDEGDERGGMFPDYDHFELYRTDALAGLIRDFAASMTTGAQACDSYRKFGPGGAVPKSHFVTVWHPPRAQAQNSMFGPPPT
jgi:mannan endo-1,4-beta-mannosidase